MKALLCTAFGPLERLAIRQIESPRPGPNQVLVDVKAASLNFPDVLMAQGLYQVKPPLPYSPGAEIAGVYWGDSVKHDPEGHLRNVGQLMEWFAAGKVKPSISDRVPLGEAAGAMRRMYHRLAKGKVVILPEA